MRNQQYLWLSLFTGFSIWSGINPKDYFTWFLEVLPATVSISEPNR